MLIKILDNQVDAAQALDAMFEQLYRFHGVWKESIPLSGDRIYLQDGKLMHDEGGGDWFENIIDVAEPSEAQLHVHKIINAMRKEMATMILAKDWPPGVR